MIKSQFLFAITYLNYLTTLKEWVWAYRQTQCVNVMKESDVFVTNEVLLDKINHVLSRNLSANLFRPPQTLQAVNPYWVMNMDYTFTTWFNFNPSMDK